MPEWLGVSIGIVVMILFLVFGSLKTKRELPQEVPSWAFHVWWLTAILLIAILLFIALRVGVPGDFGTMRALAPWAMLLGYSILIIAGLYLWKRQRQRLMLRRAIVLAVCSLTPPLVYFALRQTAEPVFLAVAVACLLITSAACMALMGYIGRR